MDKSQKELLALCIILFFLLVSLCLCSKTRTIYNELYLQSSNVEIVKKDSKIIVNGIFKNKEQANETINKFKMFNDNVQEGKISINNDIKANKDKWLNVMQNISYYFSNNLEDADLVFVNNALKLDGSTLSNYAKEDIQIILKELKTKGINVENDIKLIEAKTSKQKIKKQLYELLHSKTVEFEIEQAIIKPETYPLLDTITEKLKSFPEIKISIEGHTDSTGKKDFNKILSEDRARVIKEYFVEKGIETNRLTTIGYGENRPAFPNTSERNKRKNRRVEFKAKFILA